MHPFWSLVAATALLFAQASHAQSCRSPGAFHHSNAIRGAVTFPSGSGTDCDIVANIDADNDWTGGAFAWYTLPAPVSTWRISFRMDRSGLSDLQNLPDGFHFLSASTRHPYPQSNGLGRLLSASLFSLANGTTYVTLLAACNRSAPPLVSCAGDFTANLADGDLLRFEVVTGAGDGHVRFWINAPFTDPPAGSVDNLDNAAWQGVDMVALGVFQSYGVVAADGGSVTFSDIESLDDSVFWSNFDP